MIAHFLLNYRYLVGMTMIDICEIWVLSVACVGLTRATHEMFVRVKKYELVIVPPTAVVGSKARVIWLKDARVLVKG